MRKLPMEYELKTGEKLGVRLVEYLDLDNIWRNFNDVVAERIYLPVYTPVQSEYDKRSWFEEMTSEQNFCLVAVDRTHPRGYQIVGQLTVESLQWEAAAHVGQVGIIVREDCRNHGLGQGLVEISKQVARDRGKTKLILTTLANNQAALHLYQRCGFKEVGRYHQQYRMEDTLVDEILMEMMLE